MSFKNCEINLLIFIFFVFFCVNIYKPKCNIQSISDIQRARLVLGNVEKQKSNNKIETVCCDFVYLFLYDSCRIWIISTECTETESNYQPFSTNPHMCNLIIVSFSIIICNFDAKLWWIVIFFLQKMPWNEER